MFASALPLLTLGLIGCHAFDGTATLHPDVPMLPVIEWTSSAEGSSWVEYGLDEDYGMITPASSAQNDHAHYLLGTPPLSEIFFRAVTSVGGKEKWGKGSIKTLGVPAVLPDFRVTVPLAEGYDTEPYILGTAFGGDYPVIFVLDRAGNWLWYRQVDGDKNPIELAFDPITGDVMFNSFLTDHGEDDSNVTRISFDRTVDEDIATPLGHHAFTLLPDGSVAYIAIDVRDFDSDDGEGEVPWVGDAIRIVGQDEAVWSSWDWRDP